MSTILKALKKLEQDNRENIQGLAPTHLIGASQALGKRVKKVWLWDRGKQLTITVAILGLLVAGAYFWMVSRQKSATPDAAPADRTMAAIQRQPEVTPEFHPVPPAPAANPLPDTFILRPAPDKTASPPPAAEPDHGPGEGQASFSEAVRIPPSAPRRTESRPHEALPAPPESEAPESDSVEPPPFVPPEEMTEPLPSEEAPEPAETFAEPSSLPPDYANLDRLQDGRLELQAISWADDPNQRLAVINNRIVRQGQPIDEFTIVYIGADEVVVRQGASIWKLIFMAR